MIHKNIIKYIRIGKFCGKNRIWEGKNSSGCDFKCGRQDQPGRMIFEQKVKDGTPVSHAEFWLWNFPVSNEGMPAQKPIRGRVMC